MKVNKVKMHEEIILELHDTYINKNGDYGDSFSVTRDKYENAILIRLNDKFSRLEVLMQGANQMVLDESIDDTLLDMANYCIMELVERKADKFYEAIYVGQLLDEIN